MIILFFKLLLIFCSLGGFLLSLYIFHKKHAHEKMFCPIGGKCEAVITSSYSRFFGIPLEIIGILYYLLIFVSYLVIFLVPGSELPLASFLLFGFSITAFLFSLYLTFIQAFTLKQWCTLCLASAAFCTVIFMSALMTSQTTFISLLVQYQPLVHSFYVLALAVGLGCATVTDIFFLKFLSDYRISESEYDVLSTLSQIMWAALAAIVVAGSGLALSVRDLTVFPPSLVMSWIILTIIMINGAILNLVVAPKLLHITFREQHDHEPGELRTIHKLAFELGGVSLVSWYTAFILTLIGDSSFSLGMLIGGYFFLLIVATAVGRALEYLVRRRSRVV